LGDALHTFLGGGWLPYDIMTSEQAHAYESAVNEGRDVHIVYLRDGRARNEKGLFQHCLPIPLNLLHHMTNVSLVPKNVVRPFYLNITPQP
jgi:hypothetical protein